MGQAIRDPRAVDDVRAYFAADEQGHPRFSGSWFERIDGGGGRADVADRFTAADMTAVTMLSVRVPAHTAIRLIETDKERLGSLLTAIPTGIEPDHPRGREQLVTDGSAADTLWTQLKAYDGVGWVIAGKLLARKRPQLIPVYDDYVRAGVGRPKSWWISVADFFEGGENRQRLDGIRSKADLPDGPAVSRLRLLDIILWMRFRTGSP